MDSNIANKLFNTRYCRCSYHSMKQTIDWHGTNIAHLDYFVNVFLFVYINFRFILFIYLSHNDFKYDTQLPYNINRDDPLMSYMFQYKERYGKEIAFIFIFIELLNFLSHDALYRLNVRTLTWRWWYQLIVVNQDDYYQFHVVNFELVKLTKTSQIVKRMRSHWFWLIMPNYIIKFIANLYSRILIQYNLEHIDKERLFDKKLSFLPNLSYKLRLKLINILIISDRFACFFQILVCMLILMSF